jgi:uncharacterized protein
VTWTVRLGVVLIHAYQLLLGPFLGGACRFHPSCSAYAIEALETHGGLGGLRLAFRRVARCHPLGAAGYDPVPRRHETGAQSHRDLP